MDIESKIALMLEQSLKTINERAAQVSEQLAQIASDAAKQVAVFRKVHTDLNSENFMSKVIDFVPIRFPEHRRESDVDILRNIRLDFSTKENSYMNLENHVDLHLKNSGDLKFMLVIMKQ